MKYIAVLCVFLCSSVLYSQNKDSVLQKEVKSFVVNMINDYNQLLVKVDELPANSEQKENRLNLQFLVKYVPKDTLKQIADGRRVDYLLPQMGGGQFDSVKVERGMIIARLVKKSYGRMQYDFVFIYRKSGRYWVDPDIAEEIIINLDFDSSKFSSWSGKRWPKIFLD